MTDAPERNEMIVATVENYKSGVYGEMRTKSLLVLCGLNANEIDDLLSPFRSIAFENWRNYRRGPVK